jgi:hypothetical protein
MCLILWKLCETFYTPSINFDKLEGNLPTRETEMVLKQLEGKNDKTPFEVFQIGTIYDHQYGEPEVAEDLYRNSIHQLQHQLQDTYFPQSLIRNPPVIQEAQVVLDRLQNRIDINDLREYDEFHDVLPNTIQLQQEIIDTQQQINRLKHQQHREQKEQQRERREQKEQQRERREQKEREEKKVKVDGTEKRKVAWKIDTQNVHDHMLNEDLVKQFKTIQQENEIAHRPVPNIYMIKNYLVQSLKEKEREEYRLKIEDAAKMLNTIKEKDQGLVKLKGKTEEFFLGHLYARILSQPNKEELTKSFIQNLGDSWNGGNPVCVTGRITRCLSSFAHMDTNPNIGRLVTKEVIRNEIMEKAGKIQTDTINALTPEQQKTYNSNVNTTEIDGKIKAKISSMIDSEYKPIIDAPTLEKIKSDVLSF